MHVCMHQYLRLNECVYVLISGLAMPCMYAALVCVRVCTYVCIGLNA